MPRPLTPFLLRSAAVLALLFLCSGCIDYSEHLTIDENGKGSAAVKMTRPKRDGWDKAMVLVSRLRGSSFDDRFSEQTMRDKLPAGTSLEYRKTEEREKITVEANYTFSDASAFAAWAGASGTSLNGISLTRTKDTITYVRQFAPVEKEALEEILKNAADKTVVFKLTAPGRPRQHNGTRVEGTTIVWEVKAPELFEGVGKRFSAEFYTGPDYGGYIMIGVILFLILDGLIIYFFVKKKSSQTTA